jgi:hypothetical protein
MLKRLSILAGILALTLLVSGCTKCGFWWDDWQAAPKSCKGDWPK